MNIFFQLLFIRECYFLVKRSDLVLPHQPIGPDPELLFVCEAHRLLCLLVQGDEDIPVLIAIYLEIQSIYGDLECFIKEIPHLRIHYILLALIAVR